MINSMNNYESRNELNVVSYIDNDVEFCDNDKCIRANKKSVVDEHKYNEECQKSM